MEQTRFDQSLKGFARFTGRRDAVRSLGAIATALLTALGLADASAADKQTNQGANGGAHNGKNRSKDRHRNRNGKRGNAGKDVPDNTGTDVPAGADGAAQQLLARNGTLRAERKKRKACTNACATGPAPAPAVRDGNTDSGPGYISSSALCNPGEHVVGGGFRMFNVDLTAVVQMENAPIENDAGVAIGWVAAIETSDASKSIAAYALCVAD